VPTPAAPAALQWISCPPDPLPWFRWREPLLQLLLSPEWLLPLVAAVTLAMAVLWGQRRCADLRSSVLLLSLPVLLLSVLYSPLATQGLAACLERLVPAAAPWPQAPQPLPLAVLVGRGPTIAAATTAKAAQLMQQGRVARVYVSGDERSTADQLLRLDVPADRVAGDSCARTTWENAQLTAAWMRQKRLPGSVVLVTDPWQLARASRAFRHQGLAVIPVAAAPSLAPRERNRLALREAAGALLYALQGRM
jgi:uncharacterized SAM-binding protein YcdF (DUF218 family)